jgi:hypothetical protein
MRAVLGAIVIAAVAAATAVVGIPVASAGVSASTCTYTVSPTELDGAGTVQVAGVAPGTTKVGIQVDGVTVVTVESEPVTGEWGPVSVDIATTSIITIELPDNYATLPCIGNGGAEAVRVTVRGGSASLARTGSDTSRWVPIGIASLGLGIVLVAGARRRRAASRV